MWLVHNPNTIYIHFQKRESSRIINSDSFVNKRHQLNTINNFLNTLINTNIRLGYQSAKKVQ